MVYLVINLSSGQRVFEVFHDKVIRQNERVAIKKVNFHFLFVKAVRFSQTN